MFGNVLLVVMCPWRATWFLIMSSVVISLAWQIIPSTVNLVKPDESLQTSTEIFICCIHFKSVHRNELP